MFRNFNNMIIQYQNETIKTQTAKKASVMWLNKGN